MSDYDAGYDVGHEDGYKSGVRETTRILTDLITELRDPESWEWHRIGPCTCDVVPCAAHLAADRAETRLRELDTPTEVEINESTDGTWATEEDDDAALADFRQWLRSRIEAMDRALATGRNPQLDDLDDLCPHCGATKGVCNG